MMAASDSLKFQLAKARDQLFPRPKLCSKKNRYATMGEAQRIAKARTKKSGAQIYAYHCPAKECNGYHVTRMQPPEEAMC